MFKKIFIALAIISSFLAAVPARAADDAPLILGLGRVASVAVSPDGAQLAVGTTSGVYFYTTQTLLPTNAWQTDIAVYQLDWSPRGDLLALNGYHQMEVRELSSGAVLWSLDDACGLVKAVSFSLTGLLAVARCKALEIYEAPTGKLIQSVKGNYSAVAFGPEGKQLATCCRAGTIEIWDAQNWQVQQYLATGGSQLSWSADGKRLAVDVEVWEPAKNKVVGVLRLGDLVADTALSPDGKRFAVGGGIFGNIRVASVGDESRFQTLRGHPHWAGSLQWSPDSQTLYSAGNGTVRAWEVSSGRQRGLIDGFAAPVYQVSWSGDGRSIVSQQGAHLAATDVASRQPLSAAFLGGEPTHCLEFPDGVQYSLAGDKAPCYFDKLRGYSKTTNFIAAPTGNLVAMVDPGYWVETPEGWVPGPRGISLYNIETMQLARRLSTGYYPVTVVAFSPDGKYVAAGGGNPHLLVWEVETGALQHNLVSPATRISPVIALAFSADNRTLYSLIGKGLLQQWTLPVEQASQIQTPPAFYSRYGGRLFGAAAINLAARRLIVHSDTGITVSELDTGRALYTLPVSGLRALAVNSQGTHMAAAIGETALVWNLTTGEQIAEYRAHTDRINDLAFNPDGNLLASASSDGTVRVWPVP